MRAKSKWHGLNYLVQCSFPGNSHFETIAAFGAASVAIVYAKEVLARQLEAFSAPNTGEYKPFGWRYRVLLHKNNEPECIWRSYDQTDIVTDPLTRAKYEITRYVPPADPAE